MNFLRNLYHKYVLENGDSQELSRRIHNEYVDSVFLGSYIPIFLAIFSTTTLYLVLYIFDHNYHIHIWYEMNLIYYTTRLVMVRLYIKGSFFFFKRGKERISHKEICLMGLSTGILWLYLVSIVLIDPIYGLDAKLTVCSSLMLFSYASLLLYCMVPQWYLPFYFITFVPICIALLFYGYLGMIFGMILFCYVCFLLAMTRRNYKLHFKAIYLQYQNEEFVRNIDRYSRRLENLNDTLKLNNNELLEEIKRRKVAEKKIRKMASQDSLTGVTNRISLDTKMNRVFRYAKRSNTIVGVLFLDFDRFKLINDTFGHHVGDKLLKSIAQRLSSCIRETDEVFRIGGDEFIVLLTNVDKEESLIPLSQLIISRLGDPHLIEGKSLILKASMGISVYPGHSQSSEDLLKYADLAMYKAKENGGDSFTFYETNMH